MTEPNKLYLGDNKEILRKLDDNSVDSIITDPPFGIKFMNKKWDYQIPDVELWQECLRVLKPGGHILVACGTRTHHRMTVNIEDAGFEIRDTVAWVYGSGMPKGYNIANGVESKIKKGSTNKTAFKELDGEKGTTQIGYNTTHAENDRPNNYNNQQYNKNYYLSSEEAIKWEGWNTGLKPSMEFWTLARKPISEKSIVDNVLKWGTGGINIDESRVAINPEVDDPRLGGKGDWSSDKMAKNVYEGGYEGKRVSSSEKGRFPSNFIHDGSDEVKENFPDTKSGYMKSGTKRQMSDNPNKNTYGEWKPDTVRNDTFGDSGSASRFFYCAKASKSERTHNGQVENKHPTVKPIKLMEYLVNLITPKGGIVLDPFMGSGSTIIASINKDFRYIGIEQDENSYKTASERIEITKNNQ